MNKYIELIDKTIEILQENDSYFEEDQKVVTVKSTKLTSPKKVSLQLHTQVNEGTTKDCAEMKQLSPKRIVEDTILEKKETQGRAKIVDSERIKTKTQVNTPKEDSFIPLEPPDQPYDFSFSEISKVFNNLFPNFKIVDPLPDHEARKIASKYKKRFSSPIVILYIEKSSLDFLKKLAAATNLKIAPTKIIDCLKFSSFSELEALLDLEKVKVVISISKNPIIQELEQKLLISKTTFLLLGDIETYQAQEKKALFQKISNLCR